MKRALSVVVAALVVMAGTAQQASAWGKASFGFGLNTSLEWGGKNIKRQGYERQSFAPPPWAAGYGGQGGYGDFGGHGGYGDGAILPPSGGYGAVIPTPEPPLAAPASNRSAVQPVGYDYGYGYGYTPAYYYGN